MAHSGAIESFLRLSPVMPVVTFTEPSVAADVARALVRGGIKVIEVTLRTPVALQAIEAIAEKVPEIIVGAGTVLSIADFKAAAAAGAAFAISPGATEALLDAGVDGPIPYLPAIATASELMTGIAAGYRCFKFFPAGCAGGASLLGALGGPFPEARFCPTGGISQATVKSYLDLPNVLCVGGSWLTPADTMAKKDWSTIESLASRAAASRGVASS
jgi:2-dehydro-3-deoxyphosphogluconate aldolase / (4S)-4-hydroxy-2-oxoglutarate aldolase